MIPTLFPDLTADQLAALHRHLGAPACFLLLEVVPGEDAPAVARHEMYPRAWAEKGFVRCAPEPLNTSELIPLAPMPALLHTVRDWVERHPTAEIALVSHEDVPATAVAEVRAELQALKAEVAGREPVAVQRHNGELYLDARNQFPTLPAVDWSAHFKLQIEGRNPLEEPGPRLPFVTGVQFGPSPARHSLLRVRGIAPEGSLTPLPAEAWFRLEAPRTGTHAATPRLRIDVRPAANPAQDRWIVEWVGGTSGRIIPIAPPAIAATARPALHLAVVFDRTCPDARAWPTARQFLVGATRAKPAAGQPKGLSPEQLANFQGSPETAQEDASIQDLRLEDCNAELRRSFGPALRESLRPLENEFSRITIHPFWFADTATADFEPMDGLELNIHTWGAFGPLPASNPQVDSLFDSYDYVPSFDVFDPLENVLHEANERLLTRLHEPDDGVPPQAAIVIVGNSPPTFAPDGDDRERKALARFWKVAGAHFCPRSRPGEARSWSHELTTARNLGIPVIYALLSLDRSAAVGGGPLRQRADRVQDLERCTRDALSEFVELRITDEAPANREGLTAALRQALATAARCLSGHGQSTLLLIR